MKIAIVCDWLVTYAGAERVLEQMIQCFPEADLFTLIDFLPPKDRGFLQHTAITTSFLQRFPFAKKLYRYYLPWMPLAIEQLDVSSYDLVISSSHAVAKGVLTHPHQLHISYVHTPMRYAWDLQHQYLQSTGLNRGIKSYLTKRLLHQMRLWDARTANGVDYFIANSNFIAKRIWKTYRRQADVIYPAINTELFTPHYSKEDFYLTASRLVPYKKMDLIVESFRHLPDKKLIVIGDGPDMKKVKAKAGANVELLGFQATPTLVHYLQRAKAFIFAAEEDFGLLPVEAQAAGTPVIAYGKGGALETIRGLDHPTPTGLFFSEQTIPSLIQGIKQFETLSISPLDCANNAKRFSAGQFIERFKIYVFDKFDKFK